MRRPLRSRPLFALAVLAFAAAAIFVVFQLLAGRLRLAEVLESSPGGDLLGDDVLAWPAIVALVVLAALGLFAWWRLGLRREARADADRIAELEEELKRERERADRERQRYEAERELNRKLRERVARIQDSAGVLGEGQGLPEMILEVAIELVEAEKGLLLSRGDGDRLPYGADAESEEAEQAVAELEVIAADGFDGDPNEGELARRFAGEVIEHGEVIRQTSDELEDEPRPESVDDEIRNLVAIPIYIRGEFDGIVVCANGEAIEQEDQVLLALGDSAGTILHNSRLHAELRGSYLATVRMLAEALEVKDPFVRGHSEEVSGLVRRMGERLGLDQREQEQLIFGSLLHDLGKIGISERILLKPGPLTPEEFEAIKLHPRIGFRLVSQLPLLRPIAPAVLHHHERWDGGGYPAGLRGEQIPVEARIVAIIDAFDAMTSDRPYQEAVTVEDALEELRRCAGTHFDPELVEVFLEAVRDGVLDRPEGPAASLAEALDEPELVDLRERADPMLGFDSFALTDSLTLLRSHRPFRERLEEVCRKAALRPGETGPALIVVQVDNLDQLNRSRGWDAGDRLLRLLARGLERVAPPTALVARDSGARFAVLCASAVPDEVPVLCAELRREIPQALIARSGFATWIEGDDDRTLLERALAAAV